MKDLLTPTYMFSSYREVTPDFLREHGIRGLLLDIDNTLAPYEQEDPDESILSWVKGMQAAGVAWESAPALRRGRRLLLFSVSFRPC